MLQEFITDRLTLKLLTEEDAAFIQELVNTEGWLRFIGDRKVHSSEDAIAYIKRINATENLYYWVVRLSENGAPLGIITFIKRAYLDHFDIGFAFLPQYSGKSYAYEAAKAVLSGLSSEHATILATTMPANESSIKLLIRLGLEFEKEIEVGKDTLHVYATGGKAFT